MYLKNDSEFKVIFRTKADILSIRPGDVVHVFDSDILYMNKFLVKITEKEYEELTKEFEKPEQGKIEELQKLENTNTVKETKHDEQVEEGKDSEELVKTASEQSEQIIQEAVQQTTVQEKDEQKKVVSQ